MTPEELKADRMAEVIVKATAKYIAEELDPIRKRLREQEDEITEQRHQAKRDGSTIMQLSVDLALLAARFRTLEESTKGGR
jgi:hypothetical protein